MSIWWRHRSLRARLTGIAGLVVAVVLGASAALIVLRVQAALVAGVDGEALREAAVVATAVVGAARPSVPASVPPGMAVQVLDSAGSVVTSSSDILGEPALFSFRPSTAGSADTRTVHGLPLGGQGAFRVVTLPARGRGGDYVVYVAAPLDGVSASVAALSTALAFAMPLLAGLLVVLLWVLTGRALRPVDRMRAEATEITASDLHRRVSVPQTHDELARLALTLNDLLGRLDLSLQRQRAFVADAAHELRSPLASIITRLEVASYSAQPIEAGNAAELLGEARRLAQLTDDLLALARLDAGAHRPLRDVDLEDVVEEEVASARSRTGVPVHVAVRCAARVSGEKAMLARVVRNLVDNAVRHARTEVQVSLDIEGSTAVLQVRDDGPGIPEPDRERVFERFARLDGSRTRAAGGVGLGLAIVREAVDAHGGSVELADAAPGARFVVRIPLSPPGSPAARPGLRRHDPLS